MLKKLTILVAAVLVLGLAACESDKPKTATEKAKESVHKAVESTKEAAHDTAEATKEIAHDVNKDVKEAVK